MAMIKSAVKLAVIGFLTGMIIGTVIAVISSYLSTGEIAFYSELILRKTGSQSAAIILQVLLSGIFGSICMGSAILYDLDNWPMTRVMITHFLIIVISFLAIGSNLGWLDLKPLEILIWILLFAVSYCIVWLIMFIRYRHEVRRLNKMLDEGSKNDTGPGDDE